MYRSAKAYWESVPATVSGMLDGFTQINSVDLSSSNKFIRQFFQVGLLLLLDYCCFLLSHSLNSRRSICCVLSVESVLIAVSC